MVVTKLKRILLLEPDELLASKYKKVLHNSGFTVNHVTSAQAALHSINKQTPHIIVVEVYIKDHNGIEFLHELQSYQDTADIPVVLLTYASKSQLGINTLEWSNFSIADYCYKPKTTETDLVKVISSIKTGASHE